MAPPFAHSRTIALHCPCSTLLRVRPLRAWLRNQGRKRGHREVDAFHTHRFRHRLQEMKSQEHRVSEKELHVRFTQLKRLLLLCLLHCLHAPSGDHEWITGARAQATVDEQLRLHVGAQVQACSLRRHASDCSEKMSLDHLVRKSSAVVLVKNAPGQHRQEGHHQAKASRSRRVPPPARRASDALEMPECSAELLRGRPKIGEGVVGLGFCSRV